VSSSRLALDSQGRLGVTVTSPGLAEPVGTRYLVLGDMLRCGEDGFTFTGETNGRADLPKAPRGGPRALEDQTSADSYTG
jgi:hypothetical protein